MKYRVGVREVWVKYVDVEAESPEKALDLVRMYSVGDEQEDLFEYSHTLDSRLWGVELLP